MDEPVFFNKNTGRIIRDMRLDRNKVVHYFENARFPVGSVRDSFVHADRKPVVLKTPAEVYAEQHDESLVKKSSGLFLHGGPAAPDNGLTGSLYRLVGPSLVSWGKDRIDGFGQDIHELTFLPDGRPGPNVSEWFQWCRSNNVHPAEPGMDWPEDPLGKLSVIAFEAGVCNKALQLWGKRVPEVVMMESASVYDKIRPLPGVQRMYGELHVDKYVGSLKKLSFEDSLKNTEASMDESISKAGRRGMNGLFVRRAFEAAKKNAIRILDNEDTGVLSLDSFVRARPRRGVQL